MYVGNDEMYETETQEYVMASSKSSKKIGRSQAWK